jgi:hypothetical protein
LRQRLPQTDFRLTCCHNATLGRLDFYRQLCLALGLTPSAAAAVLFFAVSSHVITTKKAPSRTVLEVGLSRVTALIQGRKTFRFPT